jgi:hypothetical protein
VLISAKILVKSIYASVVVVVLVVVVVVVVVIVIPVRKIHN